MYDLISFHWKNTVEQLEKEKGEIKKIAIEMLEELKREKLKVCSASNKSVLISG